MRDNLQSKRVTSSRSRVQLAFGAFRGRVGVIFLKPENWCSQLDSVQVGLVYVRTASCDSFYPAINQAPRLHLKEL